MPQLSIDRRPCTVANEDLVVSTALDFLDNVKACPNCKTCQREAASILELLQVVQGPKNEEERWASEPREGEGI
jgi:hypothetical protein